jgi:hypothetical protein
MGFIMSVTYTDNAIVFVDSKGHTEKLDLMEAMNDADSIHAIGKEMKAAGSASQGAVSLLSRMLNVARIDEYKGKTPANESVPNTLKAAIREIETAYLRPIFMQYHTDKGAKESTASKLWDDYAAGLKAGGSYAVAKSEVTKYFAICGKLPVCDNGKLLSVAAIKKLLSEARKGLAPTEKPGIADKLITLASELQDRTENTVIGDTSSAIAALKAMLKTFEALQREDMEAAQATHTLKSGNVGEAAAAVVSKMQRAPKPVVA